ncbi:hypothetical protein OEZ86_007780 [Tetradesmus obliquus]|nr:hypothetical protein OEZ86_007780 [Tetradesmus obliquus]
MALSIGHALMIVAAVIVCILALISLGLGLFIAGLVLLVRPWDGNTQRDHRWATSAPYPVFWLGSWVLRAAEYVVSLKPGTLRAGELARAYAHSQVLFALSNLGVPDLLCAGPSTAAELASSIGPAVPVDWLERLLATAAAFGMLNRKKCKGASLDTAAVEDGKDAQLKLCSDKQQQQQLGLPAGPVWQYSLNGVSAALTRESPVSVANVVKMFEDQSAGYAYLAEGIRTGRVPFELWSGGQTFWQHLEANPRYAATFDAGMHEVNHFGGTAVAVNYPWSKFDCVVDVAGGVGGFLADIMSSNGKLQGVLFDQPGQIARAETLWQTTHSGLAPRAQLVAGDMFDASTIPAPPSSGRVAYVLRNILHDWSDSDCVAILRAVRSRISTADLARVMLLVVEVSTIEEVLPCLHAHRCGNDLNMLMAFGDGKERNRAEFEALFAAAGFKLRSIKPSCGILLTLEAVPV